jgi:hypothetical protein
LKAVAEGRRLHPSAAAASTSTTLTHRPREHPRRAGRHRRRHPRRDRVHFGPARAAGSRRHRPSRRPSRQRQPPSRAADSAGRQQTTRPSGGGTAAAGGTTASARRACSATSKVSQEAREGCVERVDERWVENLGRRAVEVVGSRGRLVELLAAVERDRLRPRGGRPSWRQETDRAAAHCCRRLTLNWSPSFNPVGFRLQGHQDDGRR